MWIRSLDSSCNLVAGRMASEAAADGLLYSAGAADNPQIFCEHVINATWCEVISAEAGVAPRGSL